MKAKYLNPFTDFGFKKLFGEEASKPLLTDFLNALLPAENRIKSLTFKNTERLAEVGLERKAVYDIYCENERGEKFIRKKLVFHRCLFRDERSVPRWQEGYPPPVLRCSSSKSQRDSMLSELRRTAHCLYTQRIQVCDKM
jgi:hypothetical protein